ncbi:HPF/RaiA family ribosome-associated protein [Lichenicoccus sp.]|uniref:HPF/RaiA family ribosome-associated protein n=1 Tax=Lichenicoccus sp. TaxID=2781899 RepID=UPI003D0C9B0B
MDRPLEIAFHNLQASQSLEAEIRERVARLEQRYKHLIGCRVTVEALHQQHQTGNTYEVHIVLSLPGRDLAVSHEPHHARERYAKPDIRTTVRDAFKAAERQLESFKGLQRVDASGPSGSALAGQVAQLIPGEDHGFILNNVGTQLYFHRDSLTNASIEDLEVGQAVHYVETQGDAGPVASKVRAV